MTTRFGCSKRFLEFMLRGMTIRFCFLKTIFGIYAELRQFLCGCAFTPDQIKKTVSLSHFDY